jgi:hypothetical protein
LLIKWNMIVDASATGKIFSPKIVPLAKPRAKVVSDPLAVNILVSLHSIFRNPRTFHSRGLYSILALRSIFQNSRTFYFSEVPSYYNEIPQNNTIPRQKLICHRCPRANPAYCTVLTIINTTEIPENKIRYLSIMN